MSPETQNPRKFDVGLKAFIERAGKILIVAEMNGGLWEVPGGRINVGEEFDDPMNVLRRETTEELGSNLEFTIGRPFTSWVRQFPISGGADRFVFLTGYRCQYIGGEVALSDEHQQMRWVNLDDLDGLKFAPGYGDALKKYFQE